MASSTARKVTAYRCSRSLRPRARTWQRRSKHRASPGLHDLARRADKTAGPARLCYPSPMYWLRTAFFVALAGMSACAVPGSGAANTTPATTMHEACRVARSKAFNQVLACQKRCCGEDDCSSCAEPCSWDHVEAWKLIEIRCVQRGGVEPFDPHACSCEFAVRISGAQRSSIGEACAHTAICARQSSQICVSGC